MLLLYTFVLSLYRRRNFGMLIIDWHFALTQRNGPDAAGKEENSGNAFPFNWINVNQISFIWFACSSIFAPVINYEFVRRKNNMIGSCPLNRGRLELPANAPLRKKCCFWQTTILLGQCFPRARSPSFFPAVVGARVFNERSALLFTLIRRGGVSLIGKYPIPRPYRY